MAATTENTQSERGASMWAALWQVSLGQGWQADIEAGVGEGEAAHAAEALKGQLPLNASRWRKTVHMPRRAVTRALPREWTTSHWQHDKMDREKKEGRRTVRSESRGQVRPKHSTCGADEHTKDCWDPRLWTQVNADWEYNEESWEEDNSIHRRLISKHSSRENTF
jgi:hypothetical protein